MEKLKGILCALVTPLDENENIDIEATIKLCDFVLKGGMNGIVALGSTGEQIALTAKAKIEFVKTVKSCMPKGLPLIVGCGATSTKLAINNCHDAENSGADGLIITPPCFYTFDDKGIVKYYNEIAAETNLPVYLYNISRFVGAKIGVKAVEELLANPKIVGIKESDRDETYLQELIKVSKAREDFAVIQGSDRIFKKSFDWGCSAGITVIGNIVPELAPKLYEAWKNKDEKKANSYQEELLEYVKAATMLGKFPQELKAILAYKGICSERMTSPFSELSLEEREQLLKAWKGQ